MTIYRLAVRTAIVCLVPAAYAYAADGVVPLPRAHAHNDYEHERPLLDALDHGFCSVEADIFLVDGELLVAHDREDVDPGRTLEGLYLKLLYERFQQNDGRIYRDGPEFILLIDIKADGERVFPYLRDLLIKYGAMMTTFEGDEVTVRAVRAIVSGTRPRALMERQELHYAAYDGRLDDLGTDATAAFIPLISNSWGSVFTWHGRGPMPEAERARLHEIVQQAHAEGRKVRFWAVAHREALWQELYDAGVDLINADRLDMLQEFLLTQRKE